MRTKLVWSVVMAAAAANGACSQCGEEKAPQATAPDPAQESPAAPEKDEARPNAPVRVSDAGVPEATGPVGPVPDRLRGVWEKIDQPFRGMRIELGAGGMAAVPVTAPPVDDAEAVAFYTKKNGDKEELGVQFAACMPKIWKAGVTKYAELKPTARADEWVGSTELHIVRVLTCDELKTKKQDLALRLTSKDELVATVVDPKLKTSQTETWKRVQK